MQRLALAGAAATAVAALAACQTTFEQLVQTEHLDTAVVTGGAYRHVVLRSAARNPRRPLHIYIGGDGIPWQGGQSPSRDPTPHNLLEIRLMALDTADAVYLGRPCYFGLAHDEGCSTDLWTFARYSDAVVASMASAAREIVERGAYEQVVLIGYSGGGALARLMAPRVPHVVGLITVAANLDTAAWSALHGYLPLVRSRNPADEPPLDASIMQVHAVGGHDEVVPRTTIDRYLQRDHSATLWVYPEYDHVCCWEQGWPAILARLDTSLAARLARDAAPLPE